MNYIEKYCEHFKDNIDTYSEILRKLKILKFSRDWTISLMIKENRKAKEAALSGFLSTSDFLNRHCDMHTHRSKSEL